jgi:hypothetical protein
MKAINQTSCDRIIEKISAPIFRCLTRLPAADKHGNRAFLLAKIQPGLSPYDSFLKVYFGLQAQEP